jgi:hypothetical protein
MNDYYLCLDDFYFYCNEDEDYDIFDYFLKLPDELYDSLSETFSEEIKNDFPVKLSKEKVCLFLKEFENLKCPYKFESKVIDEY